MPDRNTVLQGIHNHTGHHPVFTNLPIGDLNRRGQTLNVPLKRTGARVEGILDLSSSMLKQGCDTSEVLFTKSSTIAHRRIFSIIKPHL
jgi:hypothetical protein